MELRTPKDRRPNEPVCWGTKNRRPARWNRVAPGRIPPARAMANHPRLPGLYLKLVPSYLCSHHAPRGQRRDGCRWAELDGLFVQPRLKHEDMPQSGRPIPLFGKVLVPLFTYFPSIEKNFPTQPRFTHPILPPLPPHTTPPL